MFSEHIFVSSYLSWISFVNLLLLEIPVTRRASKLTPYSVLFVAHSSNNIRMTK
jgi:hypothetical protein